MKRFIFFVSLVGCSGGARPEPEQPSDVTASISSSTDDTASGLSACQPDVTLCSVRPMVDDGAWISPSAPMATSILDLGNIVVIEGDGRLFALEKSAVRGAVLGASDSTMFGLAPAGQAVTAEITAFRKGSEVEEISRERVAACADDRTARCLRGSEPARKPAGSVKKHGRNGIGCVGIFQVRCGPPKRLVGMCWGNENCS
jgi:hypothetical protein